MEKPGLIVAYPPYGSLSDDEIETLAAVLRTTMVADFPSQQQLIPLWGSW
jgi:hypothetical protein